MQAELDALDEKIQQLLKLCERLRKDNTQLRQRLVAVQHDNKRLSDKVTTAAARLEALLAHVPEDG